MIDFLVAMQIFACQFKGRTETVQAESCERKSPIYEVLLQHQKPPSSTFVLRAAALTHTPLRPPPSHITIPALFPRLPQMDSQLSPTDRGGGSKGEGARERLMMNDKANDKSRSDSKGKQERSLAGPRGGRGSCGRAVRAALSSAGSPGSPGPR